MLILLFITFLPTTDLKGELFSPWAIEELVGKKAPEFKVRDLSGNSVSLSSFKGRPILLNFWATWCPYCREERPYLNSLHREYKDRGLVIVSVSIDRSSQRVKAYLKRIPVDFVVLHDSSNKAARDYSVYSLPTSFLINRDSVIKYRFVGLKNWTDKGLKKLIEKLLEE